MELQDNLTLNNSSNSIIKRNYGIDLLRVVATILIVTLHVLSQGGILKILGDFTVKGEVMWFLQIICYGAVNVFGLISGYVGLESKHKLSKLVSLWFQVVLYTVLSEVAINVFFADGFSVKNIIKGFFPVSFEQNWYFSAYFVVFLFTPLLNQIIVKVEKKVVDGALIVSVVFFMILETVKDVNVLGVNSGYSVVWLALMYLVGAYIKKYDTLKRVTNRNCVLGFFGCVLLTFLSRISIEIAMLKITGTACLGTKFITYTSPIMVLQSIFVLQLFAKMKLPKAVMEISTWFAPMSFGVFIIHTTTFVYRYILRDFFIFTADYSFPILLGISIAAIVSIFLVCSLIDRCRIWLCKLCGINKLFSLIGNGFEKFFEK